MAGEAEKMMWMSDVMTSRIKQRGGQIGGGPEGELTWNRNYKTMLYAKKDT